MNDFKFIKGFFTGMLITDVIITSGLLWLSYKALTQRNEHNKFKNGYLNHYSTYTVRESNRK